MVQLVIANLHHNINQDLGCTVRVFGDIIPRKPQFPEMFYFISATNTWGSICDAILQARQKLLALPPGILLPTCIYILPLSPLMATIRAADRIAFNCKGEGDRRDLFLFFAKYWTGLTVPDITINIQDPTNTMRQGEVLRLYNEKTLVVAKAQGGGISITPRQLRRVIFEVEEWLRIT